MKMKSQDLHRHNLSETKISPNVYDSKVPDTARHFGMLEPAGQLIKVLGANSILTVGDALGRDGAYLKAQVPHANVIVSDLETSHLQHAVSQGLVDGRLDLDVDSQIQDQGHFDFVVIKESFHHFPRPWLGFYHCLEIARKGVILLEPHDVQFDKVSTYPKPGDFRDDYEKVGNYKYQLNVRECQKVAWSIGIETLVVKGFNDPYPPDGNLDLDTYFEQKKRLDLLGFEGKRPDNLLLVAFLREPISKRTRKKIDGSSVYDRPANQFEKAGGI